MRHAILWLAGLLATAAPAYADPAGSVWLPTLGISMPGALPTPATTPPIRPTPQVPNLPAPPVYDRPVVQPGLFPIAPASNDPVDQQKRALYQTQLRGYQRDLASRTGPLSPDAAANALLTQQELNRLRLQPPS